MAPSTIDHLFNVRGIVALITGGGSGLGLYAARALDANGAKAVYIVGRRKEPLEEAAKDAVNGSIIPLVGDVTSKESLAAIAETVRKEQGLLNLLFCNAGVGGPPHKAMIRDAAADPEHPTLLEFQKSILAPDMESFTKSFHMNVTSVLYTAATFLDLLQAGNSATTRPPQDSQIIITASVAGYSRFLASSFAYSLSKSSTAHLIKMLSTWFALNKHPIRVNGLAPGMFPSEMTASDSDQGGLFEAKDGHMTKFVGARRVPYAYSPAERTGCEDELGGAILFLASKAGAYLNGEIMLIDGGRTSQFPATY